MLAGKAYLSIKPEMPGRTVDERCSTVTGAGAGGAVATDAPATGGVACHSSENGASGKGSSPNRGSSKTTSSPTVGGVACHSSENGASSGVTEPEKVAADLRSRAQANSATSIRAPIRMQNGIRGKT